MNHQKHSEDKKGKEKYVALEKKFIEHAKSLFTFLLIFLEDFEPGGGEGGGAMGEEQ